MKRLIALLIALLTLLFGGVRQAKEELPATVNAPEETETVRFVDTVNEDVAETAPVIEEPAAETDLPAEPTLETEQTERLSTEKEICEPVTETDVVEPDEQMVIETEPIWDEDNTVPSFQQTEQETVTTAEMGRDHRNSGHHRTNGHRRTAGGNSADTDSGNGRARDGHYGGNRANTY